MYNIYADYPPTRYNVEEWYGIKLPENAEVHYADTLKMMFEFECLEVY